MIGNDSNQHRHPRKTPHKHRELPWHSSNLLHRAQSSPPIIAFGCALALCTGCSSSSGVDTAADSKEAYLEEQAESQNEETPDPTANWERVEIPGVGSIQIPPSMEVQDGSYQAMKEALTGTSSDTFVIQQRGLNEDADDAYNTYARILVSYDQGEWGDYRERDYDGDLYSSAEIAGSTPTSSRKCARSSNATASGSSNGIRLNSRRSTAPHAFT